MRRFYSSTILAASVAVVAALAPGVNGLAVGSPPGGFVIPIGSTARFTNVLFGACNNLSWGYQLNGGANQVQFTFPGGCGSGTAPNVTIGPFATPQTFRVFLSDNTCGAIYYSDGLPVDHVIVSGSNPYSLRWADAGGFCERTTTTANSFSGCNFCTDLSISDQAIAATATNISATEGKPFSGPVAMFTDMDTNAAAGDYSATIAWGDGSTSTGTVTGSAGSFSVSGTHTYAEEGTEQITVTITDADNPANSAAAQSSAAVADAALTASPACSETFSRSYSGLTTTFTDAASPSGTLSDFSAGINWGDGTSTAGTITGDHRRRWLVRGQWLTHVCIDRLVHHHDHHHRRGRQDGNGDVCDDRILFCARRRQLRHQRPARNCWELRHVLGRAVGQGQHIERPGRAQELQGLR